MKRELYALLLSRATQFAFVFFLLAAGFSFFLPPAVGAYAFSFRQFAVRIAFLAALTIPALSTGSTHVSIPVSARRTVSGTFLARLAVWTGMLALTLPVMLTAGGATPGAVFSTCLLLLCYGAFCLAAGQLVSAFVPLHAASYAVTAALLLAINTVQILPQLIVLPVWAVSVALRLSTVWHLEAATRGILDSRDLFFYLLPAAALLEANAVLLGRRNKLP